MGSLSNSVSRLALPASLIIEQESVQLRALIDSGCEQNLIDSELVQQLKIPIIPLVAPLCVSALNGKALPVISHQTEPIEVVVSGNHREKLSFYVFPSPQSPLVLGYPWLSLHNPHLDWSNGRVESWSPYCLSTCLQSAVPPTSSSAMKEVKAPDISNVPPEYHDLKEVFSKSRASSLPPHRPYDCAIDLFPGATLPSSRLYNLSNRERESMENYVNESLATGIIRPSSSPLGAGFFFVAKKDGSLRPCIDYRGLNQLL